MTTARQDAKLDGAQQLNALWCLSLEGGCVHLCISDSFVRGIDSRPS